MAKFTCEICGQETTGFAKVKTLDGHLICAHCAVEKSKPYKLPAQRLTLAQLQGISDPVVSSVVAGGGKEPIVPAVEKSDEQGKKGKQHCAICGKEVGFLQKHTTADKNVICVSCFQNSGVPSRTLPSSLTLEEIKQYSQRNQQNAIESKNFQVTKKVKDYLQIDEVHKKWMIPSLNKNAPAIYNYSDIVSFELIQNNSQSDGSIVSDVAQMDAMINSQNAVQDTAIMFGHNRGYCTNLQIGITVKDMLTPVVFITFINGPVQASSSMFQQALMDSKECLGVLKLISDEVKATEKAPDPSNNFASSADELLKFKQLLDMGAITQEEFDTKKKQLLGL